MEYPPPQQLQQQQPPLIMPVCRVCRRAFGRPEQHQPHQVPLSSLSCSDSVCRGCVQSRLQQQRQQQRQQQQQQQTEAEEVGETWIDCPLCNEAKAFCQHKELVNATLCESLRSLETLQTAVNANANANDNTTVHTNSNNSSNSNNRTTNLRINNNNNATAQQQQQQQRRSRLPVMRGRFEERFEELQQFKEQHGHCRVPHKYEPNLKLGYWVSNLRKFYRKKMNGEPSTLSDDQIAQLVALDFQWDIHGPLTDFNTRIEQLQQYYQQHGHVRIPATRFLKPLTEKEPNPHWQLGTFVGDMRKEYKLFQQGKPSRLNRERVEALEAVGMEWTAMGKNRSSAGDTGRPSFENRIQECKGFYAKYGHYRVSNPECADDATESFKQWVLRVRNAYQKWQQQKQDKEVFIAKHDKMLNEKRVQALNDIGFDWTADTDYLWNKRYEDMKEFYAQHGHFRAPRPSTTQEEEDGGSGDSDNTNSSRSNKNANGTDPWNGLYSWVQKTREAFRSLIARYPEALQNGNENNNEKAKQVFVWPKNIDRYMALTEERVKKLEDIGFEFIVRPSIPSFEQRLEELKQHKEKMGHANVRHDRMPDNEFRSLGRWLASVRHDYLKENFSRLTPERIKALKELGVDFSKEKGKSKNGKKPSATTASASTKKPSRTAAGGRFDQLLKVAAKASSQENISAVDDSGTSGTVSRRTSPRKAGLKVDPSTDRKRKSMADNEEETELANKNSSTKKRANKNSSTKKSKKSGQATSPSATKRPARKEISPSGRKRRAASSARTSQGSSLSSPNRFSSPPITILMLMLLLVPISCCALSFQSSNFASSSRRISRPRHIASIASTTCSRRRSSFFLPQRDNPLLVEQQGSARLAALSAGGGVPEFLKGVPSLDMFQEGLMRLFQQSSSGDQMQPLAAIVSIPFWKELTKAIQRLGEKFFAALVFVALLQGGVAVFQYRTNPSGELVIPPGPTVGVEDPNLVEETADTNSVTSSSSSATLKATSLRSGAQVANRTSETAVSTDIEQTRQKQQQTKTTEKSYDASNKPNQNQHAAILNRVNKLLVVLIPWVAGQAGIILQQYTHLFHIGSALTLASVFDIPQSYFRKHNGGKNASFEQGPKKPEQFSLLDPNKQEYHVVVVGDSLAVGLGTVEQFDKNKNNSLPFMRIENTAATITKDNNHLGPAFPQALARTLSQKLQKCVTWRSAGVDGGDVPQIQHFCLGVVEEEVKKGKSPDVVVILCGANDMKYFLSNPFQKANWPKGFRAKLSHFIREIRALAPDTIVLLPANPTQMFHKNSPLNVFPLGLLLDTMVGFWDSQKKLVADSFPSDGVMYLGLSPQEINDWYQPESVWNEEEMNSKRNNTTDILRLIEDINNLDEAKLSSATPTISLIARDGVHPNARCYAHWAKSMGEKLLTSLSLSG